MRYSDEHSGRALNGSNSPYASCEVSSIAPYNGAPIQLSIDDQRHRRSPSRAAAGAFASASDVEVNTALRHSGKHLRRAIRGGNSPHASGEVSSPTWYTRAAVNRWRHGRSASSAAAGRASVGDIADGHRTQAQQRVCRASYLDEHVAVAARMPAARPSSTWETRATVNGQQHRRPDARSASRAAAGWCEREWLQRHTLHAQSPHRTSTASHANERRSIGQL